MENKIISIETNRYSTFFKEVFLRIEGDFLIKIDGQEFTNLDVPYLLENWCTNKQIVATKTFGLIRNGKAVIGFHDSPDNLWVDMELKPMIQILKEERIIRFTLSDWREGLIAKITRKIRRS